MISRKNIAPAFKNPADAKAAIGNSVDKSRLSLSVIQALTLHVREMHVSENLHVCADIARAMFTAAVEVAAENMGKSSPFHVWNGEEDSLEVFGTQGFSESQKMFFSEDVYADIVRNLGCLGLIDKTKKGQSVYSEIHNRNIVVNHESLSPDVRDGGERLWKKVVSAQIYLGENESGRLPEFIKNMGIGLAKYRTICRYGRQIAFIYTHIEEIFARIDWARFQEVSKEYREHWTEISSSFRKDVGLVEPK